MKRRTFSGFVAFSLTPEERARLERLARKLGFAHLDPIGADLFRIGLATLEASYTPAPRFEHFLHVRERVRRVRNRSTGPISETAPDRCAAAHVRRGSSAGCATDGHESARQ